MPLAEKFNRDAIIQLLNEKGAKGVRIYLGKDTAGMVKMVLVATDEKGDDITGDFGKIMKPAQSSTQPVGYGSRSNGAQHYAAVPEEAAAVQVQAVPKPSSSIVTNGH